MSNKSINIEKEDGEEEDIFYDSSLNDVVCHNSSDIWIMFGIDKGRTL